MVDRRSAHRSDAVRCSAAGVGGGSVALGHGSTVGFRFRRVIDAFIALSNPSDAKFMIYF
jgi:hypothetical protein